MLRSSGPSPERCGSTRGTGTGLLQTEVALCAQEGTAYPGCISVSGEDCSLPEPTSIPAYH